MRSRDPNAPVLVAAHISPRALLRCLLVLAALTVSSVSESLATTYWVAPSPTGNAANNGADSTSAHATTLAWFNANCAAGDVCRFKSGTYTDGINPETNGNAGSRIRYYGFPTAPGAVIVASIYFGYGGGSNIPARGSYCTARWFATNTSAGVNIHTDFHSGTTTVASVEDSITDVVETVASTGLDFQGKSCVMDNITATINANNNQDPINMGQDHNGGGNQAIMLTNNVLSNSTITVTTTRTGDQAVLYVREAAYNTFFSNTFNITLTSISGSYFPLLMYEAYNCSFQNNAWNLTMNDTPGGTHGLWGYRDSTSYCRFVGNTMTVTGSGQFDLSLSQSGSYGGTTGHMYFGNNVIKIANAANGAWYYQNGARGDTAEFNVVAVNNSHPALYLSGGDFTDCIFRHNTFWAANNVIADLAGTTSTNSRLSSNVFYGTSANGSGTNASVQVPSGTDLTDSLGVIFNPGGTAANGLRYNGTNGTPGAGGGYGISGKAVWGDPYFQDSTYASLDVHPRAGSAALVKCLQDGYAGVFTGPDGIAPAAVTNLSRGLGHTTIAITWTAPGDDGNCGTAASYDLRYGTSTINDGNFGSMTGISTGAPQAPGSTECVLFTSADPCTTYYFALKTIDAASNTSGLSNVISGTARCTGSIEVDCGGAAARPAIEPDGDRLTRITLESPGPNPSAGVMTVRFGIPPGAGEDVELALYDISGRRLTILFAGHASQGWHAHVLDAGATSGKISPGVYFVRLRTRTLTETRTVVISR